MQDEIYFFFNSVIWQYSIFRKTSFCPFLFFFIFTFFLLFRHLQRTQSASGVGCDRNDRGRKISTLCLNLLDLPHLRTLGRETRRGDKELRAVRSFPLAQKYSRLLWRNPYDGCISSHWLATPKNDDPTTADKRNSIGSKFFHVIFQKKIAFHCMSRMITILNSPFVVKFSKMWASCKMRQDSR